MYSEPAWRDLSKSGLRIKKDNCLYILAAPSHFDVANCFRLLALYAAENIEIWRLSMMTRTTWPERLCPALQVPKTPVLKFTNGKKLWCIDCQREPAWKTPKTSSAVTSNILPADGSQVKTINWPQEHLLFITWRLPFWFKVSNETMGDSNEMIGQCVHSAQSVSGAHSSSNEHQ